VNNYIIPAYQNWHHNTNWSFKLDHSVSPTIKLSWYFSRLLDNSPNANGFTGAYTAPVGQRISQVPAHAQNNHPVMSEKSIGQSGAANVARVIEER